VMPPLPGPAVLPSASGLPPLPGPAPATPPPLPPTSGLPPLPPTFGLPPMPPEAGPSVGPEAVLPGYDDIQAKGDDGVLSALISEFQGLRQSRDTGGGAPERGRPDALDGLLVNYRSARFRSDAKKAVARGSSQEALKLGKLDDFQA